ncbi:dihydroorotase [Psychroflexus sp. ALD_RP9]|uniref:dihydroorotase n=1 Tax=Psychroflexus sp. ALD_RP9 TaxID=2777186 RepID=UPI001A8F9536|nr:dihydroorotase [Psychroflexus sp. ALD_RP9]QSS96834.1 dihydroorotase [Psychroflexus sp. ALD_RP9]
MAYLIKSAKIWNGNSFSKTPQDILIEDGLISKIDTVIKHSAAEVIRLKNLHVSPSWFEPLVSFGEPGFEERETIENGALTALKSGFSGIGLVPKSKPVNDHKSAIDFIKKAFKHDLKIYPLGAITIKHNGKDLADLFDMQKAGAVAFYDTKKALQNANAFKVALQYAKGFNGQILAYPEQNDLAGKAQVHEDENSIMLGLKSASHLTETVQLRRDLDLLAYTGAKVHIPYISCATSVEIIREAKLKGLKFTCSTSLNNLYFDTSALAEFDSKYKIKPPLRSFNDKTSLVEGVKDGSIDFVTSDHEPVNLELKQLEFENSETGSIGLESFYPALNKLFGNDLAINQLLKNWEIYGLKQPKISINEMAELTLFNPDEENIFSIEQLKSTCKNSIFLGEHLKGKVYGSFVNNKYYEN